MDKKDTEKKSDPVAEETGIKSKFNVLGFVQESKDELSKVVWPGRQQLISESVAVVLMVVLSASIIYLADKLFVWMAGKIFL
jgi:preprotein translocase subunit SecE